MLKLGFHFSGELSAQLCEKELISLLIDEGTLVF